MKWICNLYLKERYLLDFFEKSIRRKDDTIKIVFNNLCVFDIRILLLLVLFKKNGLKKYRVAISQK